MRAKALPLVCLSLVLCSAVRSAEARPNDPARQLREYRDFATGQDGNAAHGRELFNNEQRAACFKCHSVDGTSSKAGPDLYAVGDKSPRPDLITAVLEPSAAIAVGYASSIVETRSDEEFQ